MNAQEEKSILAENYEGWSREYDEVKKHKERRRVTNQQIADATGVPISTVAKFFSGALKSPGLYNVAAMCAYLGVSLDALFGINGAEGETAKDEHIRALEHEVAERTAQTERLMSMLEGERRSRRRVLIAFLGVVVVMLAVLAVDALNGDLGFIRCMETGFGEALPAVGRSWLA